MSKILWAVDPFEDDLQFDDSTCAKLAEWASQKNSKIEPVYVLTPSQSKADETRQIEEAIRKLFLAHKIETEKPVLLINQTRSIAKAAESVVEHAKKSGAEMMMVSSHGRTGFARMRLGSFAEALLMLSHVPVVFLNRKPVPTSLRTFGRVLWATDFSEHCKKAYEAFLRDAKDLVSEIFLFHDVSLFVESLAYASYSGAIVPLAQDVIKDQEKWAAEQSTKWLKAAQQHGYTGSYIVNVGLTDFSGTVLNAARDNGVGLVAMASNLGPYSSVLFGSESYGVFRSGEFPVWVYGPRAPGDSV